MSPRLFILLIALAVIGYAGLSSLFIVQQNEQVLVTQLGNPVRVVREPGLNVKMPFLQDVRRYEKRLIDVDPPAERVLLGDQRLVDVDAYARYRIIDPLAFYQAVRDEPTARRNMTSIITASIRRVLGGRDTSLTTLLSDDRERVMAEIQREVTEKTRTYGVEVVDVRLGKAELPPETSQAIFNRMRSERDREAKEARAQGQEQAQEIRSRADRERTVLLAEAQRDAQQIRGEGDGRAIKIYADAFGKDPQFFAFYRSMQAYRTAITPGDTLILSPEAEFFRYLDRTAR